MSKKKLSINIRMKPVNGPVQMAHSENFHKLLTKWAKKYPDERKIPKGNLIYGLMLLASEIHENHKDLQEIKAKLGMSLE